MPNRSNPYEPPSLESSRRAWPGERSAAWLSGLLVAHVLVSGFRVALYAQVLSGWDVLPGGAGWVEKASRLSWALSLALVAPTLAAYSLWIFRLNGVVRALRPEALEFTPGWSVAATFVPVVNLVAPFRAVDEIRAVVAPGAGGLVRLWWALWIASLSLGLVSRLAELGDAAVFWAPVHDSLWAASAAALFAVARALDRGLVRRRTETAAAA